jgi:eukaryotic-like serine/threonine-protein kinase
VSEIAGSGVGAAETPSGCARLTAAQMMRMSRLLDEALELDEAGRREWLAALSAEDQDIAEALREALSLGSAGTGKALSTLPKVGADADAGLNTTTSGLTAGARVGPYELIRPLGAGGMAEVWLARRADGAIKREAALKLPLLTRLRRDLEPRFAREREILAGLSHPHIARLFDAGFANNGQPYLALEYVVGTTFTMYCDQQRLTIRERLELFRQVLSAVQYAHTHLVIHRDLKPSNVLVTEAGQVQLLDFGIAKLLSEGEAKETELTQLSGRPLTPDYAAPEQISGAPITTAADVYALGVILYEILTRERPYRLTRDTRAALEEAILQTDPVPPSRAALGETAATARGTTTKKLSRSLRGDLDVITVKALKKSPKERYQTASALDEDIGRYLTGEPVLAQPDRIAYRSAKFARRHWAAISVVSLLILTLAGGLAATSYEAQVASAQRDAALQAQAQAARRGDFLVNLLKSADPHIGKRDVTVAELLDSATKKLEQNLGQEPLVEASMLGLISDTNSGLGRYAEALAGNERELALLKTHNSGALEIARALLQRGDFLIATERDAEAKPLLTDAMQLLRGLPGADTDYGRALNEFGMAAMDMGDYQGADKMFREAIAIDFRGTEEMHRNMGDPMQNLAVLLFKQGRYVDAAAAARDTIAALRQYRATDAPSLLQAEAGYALTLAQLRRPAEAEAVLRDVIAQGIRIRGAEHPETLASKIQLGENLVDLQRYAEAAELLRPTAESLDRVLGPNHTYTSTAWGLYAVAACNGPNAADGLAAEQRMAEMRAKTLPAGDWRISNTQAIIGLCLTHLRRYAEAEPILRQAADTLESSRGTGFSNTQRAYKYLRDLYLAMDRPADAELLAGKIQATPGP